MSTHKESRIEDFAFDYLSAYYTQHCKAANIIVGKGEKAKSDEEADGLFVFKQADQPVFTVVLSTGNSDELARLLKGYERSGLGKLRFLTAVVLLAATFILAKPLGILYAAPIALIIAVAGIILHTHLLKKHYRSQIDKHLSVLKKLPANEQWIGISISSLLFKNNKLAQHLREVCTRRGIGLITVGKRAKVVLMEEPRTITCRKGDFLSYYASEARIRKALSDDPMMRVA